MQFYFPCEDSAQERERRETEPKVKERDEEKASGTKKVGGVEGATVLSERVDFKEDTPVSDLSKIKGMSKIEGRLAEQGDKAPTGLAAAFHP